MILHQSSETEEQPNQHCGYNANECLGSTFVEPTESIHSRGEIAAQAAASPAKEYRGVTHTFVLSKNKKPLMPCPLARAHELLKKGKAVIHKLYPFTIRLKNPTGNAVQPIQLKPDPGSQHTGLAVITKEKEKVLFLAELKHRRETIKQNLITRSQHRRSRRSRLRYREARFDNRPKPEGWLPPSTRHLLETTISWVNKFRKLCPITEIMVESYKYCTLLQKNNGYAYHSQNPR
jgi:hypothetical protein